MTPNKTAEKKEKKITNQITLEATKRDIFGKKLKKLRKEGILPANIFGQEIKSQAISIKAKEFARIYRKVGQTQVIYLHLKEEEKDLPVLIQNVQKDPVTDLFLHVDFRHINLEKKLQTAVPLKFVGESEAVKLNKGVLLTMMEEIMIEALPNAIPHYIEVDLTPLKELNQEIRVKDLKSTADYSIVDEPEKIIVRITAHKEESTESQVVAPETVEVTTEKKEGEGEAAEKQPAATTQPAPEKEEKK